MSTGARGFPVLNPPPGCPRLVTWSSLDNAHAQKVHGQTLARLAQRGGLSPREIFGNVRRLAYRDYGAINEAAALDLCERIAHNGDAQT